MRRCLKEIIETMGFEEHFNEFTAAFEDERSGDIMEVIVKESSDENGVELLEFHFFDEAGNFRGKYYLDQMIVAAEIDFKLHRRKIMHNVPQKMQAMVHSLNAKAEVTILEKVGDNDYRVEYQGKVCTAIFNPFVGLYYVDDVYGVISERK